jgi:hypothetical protein
VDPAPIKVNFPSSYDSKVITMTFQMPIEVSFDDFAKAVAQLPSMKRPPGGKKGGVIPTDTLLSKDREGLMVETSVISTYVPASRPWIIQASINAKLLLERCKTLKQIGASGGIIEISIKDAQLVLKFKTTIFSLPTLWIEEDPQPHTPITKRIERLRK